MVKTCPHCGAENKDIDNFCQSCGQALAQKLQQPQSQTQNQIACTSCGQSTSTNFNNCPNCGALLGKITLSEKQQPYTPSPPPYQKPTSTQKTKGFMWWKCLTWPFTCLGALLSACFGCCCDSCCGSSSSSSKSLKQQVGEEVAEEAIDKVLDLFSGD